jgi:protein-disulfide isomerase
VVEQQTTNGDSRLGDGTVADEEQGRNGRRQVWLGVGLALAVLVLLTVVSLVSGQHSGAEGQPGASAAPAGKSAQSVQRARMAAARRIPGDPLAMGSPTAPVVIIEWADFQCPYCGEFAKSVEPTLVTQYVNTGKARLEWRDFAFLGPESDLAAVAARAAGRQGKFWPYHDVLYAQQLPENSGALSTPYLVGVARKLGLDVARFQADMKDPKLSEQVAADQTEGTSAGVNGTPAVLINGQYVDGSQPLATYQQAIDAALAKANTAR